MHDSMVSTQQSDSTGTRECEAFLERESKRVCACARIFNARNAWHIVFDRDVDGETQWD